MLRATRLLLVFGCSGALAACGAPPDTPTTPTSAPSRPTPGPTTGHTVDVLSSAPAAGVLISGAAINGTTSNGDGSFTITPSQFGGTYIVDFSGPNYVTRETDVKVPGADPTISLIPATFDLSSFDQFARSSGVIRRWTTAPPLEIERRILAYGAGGNGPFKGEDATLSDEDVADLVKDLVWALPQLTGGQLQNFAGVMMDTAPALAMVSLQNPGVITVARVSGLRNATTFDGQTLPFGTPSTIMGAFVLLDAAFDQFGSSSARRDLRAHELGHALGYGHVTNRTSLMNPTQIVDLTDFDRLAGLIAYQRPNGNRSPDTDPLGTSINAHAAPVWGVPIH